MMKTAMKQLADKTEKAILYATPDEANLLRGVLHEIKSLLPIERQQLEDAWSESYIECFTDTENGEDYFVLQATDFNHYFKTTYNE